MRTEFVDHMREDVQASVVQRLGDMEQLRAEDVVAAITWAITRPLHVNDDILTIYLTGRA